MAREFFRRFRNHPNDLTLVPGKGYRLSSALFRNKELSVDDGEACSALQTATRYPGEAGVASLSATLLSELQLKAEPAPEDDNPAHCLIRSITSGKASTLAKRAVIVLPCPGVTIISEADS